MNKPAPKPMKGSPLKLVSDVSGKDPAYLKAVRALPCCICGLFPAYAHHTICGRYSQGKTPDRQAIPLCEGHHQGLWDTTKLAIHKNQTAWVAEFGPDTDYIEATQDAIERLNQ